MAGTKYLSSKVFLELYLNLYLELTPSLLEDDKGLFEHYSLWVLKALMEKKRDRVDEGS
jgi:hypothetical protein